MLQPSGYWADFQLVAARRLKTSAMLVMGSNNMQATINAMPSMLRVNLQALVNDVMLTAITFAHVCIVVI